MVTNDKLRSSSGWKSAVSGFVSRSAFEDVLASGCAYRLLELRRLGGCLNIAVRVGRRPGFLADRPAHRRLR